MKALTVLIFASIVSCMSLAATKMLSADECKISKKSADKGFDHYSQIDKLVFVAPEADVTGDSALPITTKPSAATLMLSGRSLGGGLILPVMGHVVVEQKETADQGLSKIQITEIYSGQLTSPDEETTYSLSAVHTSLMIVDHLQSYDFNVSIKNDQTGKVTQLTFNCADSTSVK